jgi:ribonucleoside-diphosphate reductase alpha subunit
MKRVLSVTKRDGSIKELSVEKIHQRFERHTKGLKVNIDQLVKETVKGLFDKVHTQDVEELIQQNSAYNSTKHPDYMLLAGRLAASSLHHTTLTSFSKLITQLHEYVHPVTKERAPLVSDLTHKVVMDNEELFQKTLDYSRDLNFDYFGFMTLYKSYLLKMNGIVAERPQHMFMRVAIGIHGVDVESVIRTYEMLSKGQAIHASPTLFNSGTPSPQMSSCFLIAMKDDSIDGIFDTLKTCGLVSKYAGGIGFSISNIRARGSYIRGTNGVSNGLVPMLRLFNDTARYVDQCFDSKTYIWTDSGPMCIENVKEGDLVFSHTGKKSRVTKVLKYENSKKRKVLKIKTQVAINPVIVTEEHQIFVFKESEFRDSPQNVVRKISCGKCDLVDAKDIEVGDFACYPEQRSRGFYGRSLRSTMSYSRIDTIDTIFDYQGTLYDLEVEDEHTYVTEMGAVHNGGGKRKGAFAAYLEPWHADIEDYLLLKRNTGKEEERARDLFYALYTCDLFMKRIKNKDKWSLFCPNECPELFDLYGKDFEELYIKYEERGMARKTIKAQYLWDMIIDSQIETGTPYMVYKDACNEKSNQKNLGTIRSSNLCCEIVQYSSSEETAVCNLASISLSKCVTEEDTPKFDHELLYNIAYQLTVNLNRIIDVNYYPIKETEKSNKAHRPIGIGVQGLADVFFKLRMPFDSKEAAQMNKDIFETIYFAALTSSKDLAKKHGPYPSYEGSPVSKGILQFDMWNTTPSSRWDWQGLKKEIKVSGVRNSLLTAAMPTASTSQILGNTECFEPQTSNIYVRRVLSGEFPVINRYLVRDLENIGLWDSFMINKIIANNGSIQDIEEIPKELKDLYKTVWEIKQRVIIDMSADRAPFIDQSQSLNLFIEKPSHTILNAMHFYAWEKGLKTGMYYLRTKPASSAIKFTVDMSDENIKKSKGVIVCNEEEGCLTCSS